MSDIKKRLQESTDSCLKAYEAWDAKKNDADLRENLQETIHDLRKVGSRLEIEIAISERESMSGKPIPIPPHRSSSKDKGNVESILPDEGNTVGSNGNGQKNNGGRRSRNRRPAQKK